MNENDDGKKMFILSSEVELATVNKSLSIEYKGRRRAIAWVFINLVFQMAVTVMIGLSMFITPWVSFQDNEVNNCFEAFYRQN